MLFLIGSVDSSSFSPLLRQIRPVRAISTIPNLAITFCIAAHCVQQIAATSISSRCSMAVILTGRAAAHAPCRKPSCTHGEPALLAVPSP